jgi:hypothetical protein
MDATTAPRSLNAGVAPRRCEANRVDFVFGLARNPRLIEELAIDLAWAEEEAVRTGQPARRYKDFRWLSNDIRNPAAGDIENPATPVTLMPRPEPVRCWT